MKQDQFRTLKSRIKTEAQRLGFSMCGFTTPDPPANFSVFENWLSLHRHAGMGYLATDYSLIRRRNPRTIFPDCQTIVCLAAPYSRPDSISTPKITTPVGRVAAYAWGRDYHQVLPERLNELVSYIQNHSDRHIETLIYTDTGPLLEKGLAQRAGLGWIGKNSCLINPQIGSYFFLAEILLDLKLEPDAPVTRDYCGRCQRCVAACPTSCILPDRTLDAARCLSYLTIENRAEFPSDLRSSLDRWVFGCDICQMVCPWNIRFAPQVGEPIFDETAGAAWVDLQAIITLSPQEFKAYYHTSAISRAHRKGLQVSAMIALGNQRNPARLPVIKHALQSHDSPAVRKTAVWSLCQFESGVSRPFLEHCLATEIDPEVRQAIMDALS